MSRIIYCLVIITIMSRSAGGAERLLFSGWAKKTLADYDKIAALALQGIGESRPMDDEDCRIEIAYARHQLIKVLAGWEERNPESAKRNGGVWMFQSYLHMPCVVNK